MDQTITKLEDMAQTSGKENWQKAFKRMKKELGLTNADIAEITGHTEKSIKTMTCSKTSSRWVKLALYVHEQNKNKAS